MATCPDPSIPPPVHSAWGDQSHDAPDLGKLKVAELRSELRKKNLSATGNKDALLRRLKEAKGDTGTTGSSGKRVCSDLPGNSTHSSGNVAATAADDSIDCKCGIDVDKPVLQCLSCSAWSHTECYGYTEDDAKKVNFLCHKCAINSNLNACNKCAILEKSLLDLQKQVNNISRSLNSHLLSLRGDIHVLKVRQSDRQVNLSSFDISAALAPIHDNLNMLNQQVESILGAHSHTRSSQVIKDSHEVVSFHRDFKTRKLNKGHSTPPVEGTNAASGWGSPPLSSLHQFEIKGVDQSTPLVVIGKMVESIYLYDSCEVPDFMLTEASQSYNSSSRSFFLELPSGMVSEFPKRWSSCVRQKLGFTLIQSSIANPVNGQVTSRSTFSSSAVSHEVSLSPPPVPIPPEEPPFVPPVSTPSEVSPSVPLINTSDSHEVDSVSPSINVVESLGSPPPLSESSASSSSEQDRDHFLVNQAGLESLRSC